ncbi:MAG: hypothetical protein KAV41_02765 [Candidatus Pacebacteria bacterium]|nr:hypothetical protein [Candidatus Paceibacterota bacterium]
MQARTSFIPKKNYSRKKPGGKSYTSLAMIISVAIFGAAIFAAAGVFFYNQFLTDEIKKKVVILEKEKGSLDLETIQELTKLDKRIESAKKILDRHVSLIPLFELLEKNTLRNVRFKNFKFGIEKDGIILDMNGVANSYAAVALQADIFGEDKNITEPVFSDLGVDFNGNVTFRVIAKIDPRLISFRNSVAADK